MTSTSGPSLGFMIRLDEAESRGGAMTAAPAGAGFLIASFFDVFVELSFDGGETWDPQGSSLFELLGPDVPIPPSPGGVPNVPEPGTLLLVRSGGLALARGIRRRGARG